MSIESQAAGRGRTKTRAVKTLDASGVTHQMVSARHVERVRGIFRVQFDARPGSQAAIQNEAVRIGHGREIVGGRIIELVVEDRTVADCESADSERSDAVARAQSAARGHDNRSADNSEMIAIEDAAVQIGGRRPSRRAEPASGVAPLSTVTAPAPVPLPDALLIFSEPCCTSVPPA